MSLRFAAIAAALINALACAPPSLAHEGHDRDAAPPAIVHASPRAEAQSTALELVAVPKNGELEIWLDPFDTNAPMDGASISIETPAGPAEAMATGPGHYHAPVAWAKKPGRTELIFTVMAGADIDVLSASLVVPEPATDVKPSAAAARSTEIGKISPWIAAVALMGGAAAPIDQVR